MTSYRNLIKKEIKNLTKMIFLSKFVSLQTILLGLIDGRNF